MLSLRVLLAFCLALPATGFAQTAKPATQFDVISIKPHKDGENGSSWRWTSTGFEIKNTSLKGLIASARGVKTWLVFGLPPWAESTRWDIQAKVSDDGAAPMEKLTAAERNVLMESLLKDRFALAAHTENKVRPVFEMTTMPDGVKMKPSDPPPADAAAPKFGRGSFSIGRGTMKARSISLRIFTENIAYQVERSILDKTGLTGEYDFELHWTPDDSASTADASATGDVPPPIFQAIQEQLGLKLTPAKAAVPTVVVDKITRPDAN